MKYKDLIDKYSKYATQNNEYDIELEGINYIIQETNNLTRSELILALDKEVLNFEEIDKMLIDYCIKHIPSQYIVGHTYFYGLKFLVNSSVLIPRFDTEILVEEVINYINKKSKKLKCVDIGTGSGAIAISIKKNCEVEMDAIDISKDALSVAIENAKINNVNISFIQDDLLNNNTNCYDLIVSNPPYIDYDDANEGVSKMVNEFEPHLALYSNDKGLYHYKKIIDSSLKHLKDDGIIFFEIPDNKYNALVDYASKYYNNIKCIEDYHHLKRVLIMEGKKI